MSPLPGILASQITGHLNYNSYESIATVTVGSTAQPTITFSSIPQTYKNLQIRGIARSDRSGSTLTNTFLQINGNSTTPYTHLFRGYSGTPLSGAFTDGTGEGTGYIPAPNATANVFAVQIIDILDYTNANKYKTIRTTSGLDVNGSGLVSLFSSADMSTTNAITSIVLAQGGYNFTQYSSFALYGIKG